MEQKDKNKEDESILQGIKGFVIGILNSFGEWLKPNPEDHWSLQVLKSIGKLPLVILLIVFSPVLLVLLLIVFLIAL